MALIRKSGAFLADLTGANPNVMHEVGLAEASDKTAMLIVEDNENLVPSNFGYHAVVSYFPDDPRWPERSIEDAVTVWDAGRRSQKKRSGQSKTRLD